MAIGQPEGRLQCGMETVFSVACSDLIDRKGKAPDLWMGDVCATNDIPAEPSCGPLGPGGLGRRNEIK